VTSHAKYLFSEQYTLSAILWGNRKPKITYGDGGRRPVLLRVYLMEVLYMVMFPSQASSSLELYFYVTVKCVC